VIRSPTTAAERVRPNRGDDDVAGCGFQGGAKRRP
jgi:hypothetical protein